MATELPAQLRREENFKVLNHLRETSAHSDVADALRASVKPLGAAKLFCPDDAGYRYLLVHTEGFVIAAATGMNCVLIRLNAPMKARALECGARPAPECGADWVSFLLFRNDWPKVDLEFWVRKAYVNAREELA